MDGFDGIYSWNMPFYLIKYDYFHDCFDFWYVDSSKKIILSLTQKVPKSDSFILDSKTYKQ